MSRCRNVAIIPRIILVIAIATVIAVASGCARAQTPELPRELSAKPCAQAPAIDGILAPEEWRDAAHYQFPMTMRKKSGETRVIDAEFWAMNSATKLYLALRLPDEARQASLRPFAYDIVAFDFCKGEKLAAGDDKKALGPGLYADKHLIAPGKDADDARRDGKGSMGYTGKGSTGAHFIELEMPLNSGDPEDLASGPGQLARLNIIFADNFNPELTDTWVGGVFGPDADNAQNWGTLKMADTTAEAQPAVPPEWLANLFPYVGEPDEFDHRLQRTELAPLEVDGKQGGEVVCKFTYPEIDGKIETGMVKFFLPPVLAEKPGTRVPLFHAAGYEVDANLAMPYLREGIAVATVHAHPLNPMSRGPKLEWALLHAERRLPFIDDARVFIHGGSAGGYTTLALASETFPLVCAMPFVPPVNWAYNYDYVAKNKERAFSHREGSQDNWLPVVAAVTAITDQCVARFGPKGETPACLELSPVRLLPGITAPIQAVFSTADMLVPIDQVGAAFVQPINAPDFPPGFTLDPNALISQPEYRTRLLDVLPADAYELFTLAVPEGTGKQRPDGSVDGGVNKPLAFPFSRTRQWSLVIINEGAPEPQVGHLKYALTPDITAYWHWALGEKIKPDQLTPAKLARLMDRYQGKPFATFEVYPGGAPSHPAQVLDYPRAEKADVLRSLRTFAQDDACARRLAELYAALPAKAKALGLTLGAPGDAESVRKALGELGDGKANI